MAALEDEADKLARIAEPVFYRTRSFPCSYLSERDESRILTVLTDDLSERGLFDILQRFGFRRSQRYLYRPACHQCHACIPVRIRVSDFTPSRTQRKQRHRNSNLSGCWEQAKVTSEFYQLFSSYECARHSDSDMAQMSMADLASMIEDSPVDTRLFTLRDETGVLMAACLVDVSDDGYSAVYSFFNTSDSRRSLGTELILRLTEEAQQARLPYLYLGYWIAESRKMAYKIKFSSLEKLIGTRWSE